jgi:hypothetical protein
VLISLGVVSALVVVPVSPTAQADTTGPTFTWTPTGIQMRQGAAMAFDEATGNAVLFGGLESTSYMRDTWTWDGTSWTPRTPAHSPPARAYASIAYDAATGTVVLFGGQDDEGEPRADTWTWDGSDWTKQTPANSPGVRWGAAMAYDSTHQKVVLFGGYDLHEGDHDACPYPNDACMDTWTWDGADWTHEAPANSPFWRWGAAMAYDSARNKVVLFGGITCPHSPCIDLDDTWTWDGTDWTQEAPVTSSPPGRHDAQMSYDSSTESVVLFGGATGSNCPSPTDCPPHDDTWTWDGTDWTLQTPADNPPARSDQAMTYDPVGQQVIVFGGCCLEAGPFYDPMGDWWTWDGPDWTQQGVSTNPAAREWPSMVYDAARRNVVLFGGGFCCGSRDETWSWDGATWTEQAPSTIPDARLGAAMTYDPDHQQVVMFGGETDADQQNTPFGDTWTWNGNDWAEEDGLADSPSARPGAVMAWDSAAHSAVLFGGQSAACHYFCADTWTWDGSNWTQEHPDHSPPARGWESMAYDPAAGEVVLFGGRCNNQTSGVCGDTWTWDGSDWTEQNPADSPSARWASQMAFDPASQAVLLFGGTGSLGSRETWEWNGQDWTQLSLAESPPARYGGAMAFDSNGSALLFGGYVQDPGVDSGSFSFGVRPAVVRVLGKVGGKVATRAASTLHPLASSVTVGQTDAGGMVSIALLARATRKAPSGYAFLPTQAVIKAPPGSPSAPLGLSFTLDPSLIAGDPGGTVSVFRTEFGHTPQLVAACTSTSPPTPDPCVSAASTTGNGGRSFTILTSSASTWNFPLPGVTRSLTIAYHRAILAFTGTLKSSRHACVARQKVTVRRRRPGPDQVVGTGTTSSTGAYKVHDADPRGEFYATIPQREISPVGICEAARSTFVKVGSS